MPAPLSNPNLVLSLTSLFFFTCLSIDPQGQALLQWRSTLKTPTGSLSSWDPSHDSPCNWLGVFCNFDGGVRKLILKSINLQGPLPANFQSLLALDTLVLSSTNLTGPIHAAFGEYRELVFIDISDNAVSGEIPAEICKLTRLRSLYLNTNSINGRIPADIGNLSSLKHLILFDNQLAGEIPKSIGDLGSLEAFRAGGNKNLIGDLPWEIGNCTNLTVLGLAETAISGRIPASIGKLKTLQTLAIYTSLLSGPIPMEISNCTDLQNLYLYQNSITGSIPKTIGELKNLGSILLWANNLVGTIPFELGTCMDLKVIDLSENQLTGSIPGSFGGLSRLEELQLSVNQLTGIIPAEITNCTSLTHLEIDNNAISGEIPPQISKLRSLTLFFAWKNKLTGVIPDSLSECGDLQALDLSYNLLTGSIPKSIFGLTNLTKLLLIGNDLTGFIPPEIGNCTNLYRFRINDNQLGGTVPSEIGRLKVLNFLDMSNNRFVGGIPMSISDSDRLEFLDLHSNALTGPLPDTMPKSLQFVDISDNRLTGIITASTMSSMSELTKLNLNNNRLSGKIPAEIVSCSRLQLLDLGSNSFSEEIPKEIGLLPSLEISLNLSRNEFTGVIPTEFSSLDKLGILDVSYNKLSGKLEVLKSLQNLVSLNVSFNEFFGELPNTPFFRKLPLSDLAGNRNLYLPGGLKTPADPSRHNRTTMKLAMAILVSTSVVLVLLAVYVLVKSRMAENKSTESESWEITFYQKLDFSIDDVVSSLTSSNVIGTGSSGVVYKVTVPDGSTLAVKKMWSSEESGAFSSEIQTLGSIRHKNVVRLLGWGSNGALKLLFYNYLPNGSLSSLLHGPGKGGSEWESRYDVVLGVGHALAYLHHDCMPPIMHGDVKAMNVLLGLHMEPYLADFGLARPIAEEPDSSKQAQSQRPQLAGSYGYMAPEHASMQRITEKSDVYSFGVVLLEVLTGRHPLDPTLPGGTHLVQWVRDHLHNKGDPIDVLDPKLRGRADPQMHEMLQTLAVAFLCLATRAEDRPMMKDVVAMLKEIRGPDPIRSDSDMLKGSLTSAAPKSPPPKRAISQGSSSCSFAFSDDSV